MGTESEDEYEELLVAVEFEDPVPEYRPDIKFKMLGLDTETPFVQYNKQILRGKWIDSIDTKLFFAETNQREAIDPAVTPRVEKPYDLEYKTNKVLRLSSFVLKPKGSNDEVNSSDEEVESDGADGSPTRESSQPKKEQEEDCEPTSSCQ